MIDVTSKVGYRPPYLFFVADSINAYFVSIGQLTELIYLKVTDFYVDNFECHSSSTLT